MMHIAEPDTTVPKNFRHYYHQFLTCLVSTAKEENRSELSFRVMFQFKQSLFSSKNTFRNDFTIR